MYIIKYFIIFALIFKRCNLLRMMNVFVKNMRCAREMSHNFNDKSDLL